MRRTYYLLMVLISVAFLGADYAILTSSHSLSRIARVELDRMFGEALSFGDVRASLSGGLRVMDLDLRLFHVPFLKARKAEIHFVNKSLTAEPERILLESPVISLSDRFIQEMRMATGEARLQDRLSHLPILECRDGLLELIQPDFFHYDRLPALAIERLMFVPFESYRYYVTGSLSGSVLGEWRISGEMDLDQGTYDLDLATEPLVVTPALREILVPRLENIWDHWSPAGSCEVGIRARRRDPDGPHEFLVTVKMRSAAITFRPFPYPIEQIEGEIDFYPDRFVVKYAQGRAGGAMIRLRGDGAGYNPEGSFLFQLEADDLPLDDKLRNALSPEVQKVWDRFRPRGLVHVHTSLAREAGPQKPLRNPLSIDFRDLAFTYEDVPYEIHGAQGELFMDEGGITLKKLMARDETKWISMEGTLRDVAADPRVHLRIQAEEFSLDERLRAALSMEARRTWDQFLPRGIVDVDWTIDRDPGSAARHRFQVHCRKNKMFYREVPLNVEDIEGYIEGDENGIRLDHVTGKYGNSELKLHGWIKPGKIEIQLDGIGIPIDENLKRGLPRTVSDLLNRIRLYGTVNLMTDIDIKTDEPRETRYTADVKLKDGRVDTAVAFENMKGTVTVSGYAREEEQALIGYLNFEHAMIDGKRVSDLSASVHAQGDKITFNGIKASAYGGILSGAFSIHTKTGQYSGQFEAHNLELKEYVLDTRSYANRTLFGKVGLEIKGLEGTAGDAESMTGKGKLSISEGYLWDVPLLLNLFALNPNSIFKRKGVFDAGTVHFEIAKKKFFIRNLLLTGEDATILGGGRINFDGDVHLVLQPQVDLLGGIPLIKYLTKPIDILKDTFFGVDIHGTFEEPKVSAKFFPNMPTFEGEEEKKEEK